MSTLGSAWRQDRPADVGTTPVTIGHVCISVTGLLEASASSPLDLVNFVPSSALSGALGYSGFADWHRDLSRPSLRC